MGSKIKLSLVVFFLAVSFIFPVGTVYALHECTLTEYTADNYDSCNSDSSVSAASAVLDGCYDVSGKHTYTVKVLGYKESDTELFKDTFCFYPKGTNKGSFKDGAGLEGSFTQNGSKFSVTYNKSGIKNLFKQMFKSYGFKKVSITIKKAYINGTRNGDGIQGSLLLSATGSATYKGKSLSFSVKDAGKFEGIDNEIATAQDFSEETSKVLEEIVDRIGQSIISGAEE